jgi:hypothetical protein
VPGLPNQWNAFTPAGSQWIQAFTLQNDDGTPVNIAGWTWEFVIRPNTTDTASPALVQVTTTSSAQGYITVDTVTGTVTVVLNPAATALLSKGARPYTLWSNPGTTTALAWVDGTFNSQLVAAA